MSRGAPERVYGGQAHSWVRSARLVILSLTVVGVAFGVYQLGVEPIEQADVPVVVPEIHQKFVNGESIEGGVLVQGDARVVVGEESGITILDEDTLRKKMHMKFDRPRQVDDVGRLFHVSNPVISSYMKKGQKAVIRADEAVLTSREQGKVDPQEGVLKGHVRIELDRATDEWRAADPQRAELPTPQHLLVRLWMEEMEFDLDVGRLTVPGKVRIEAEEMILEGENLQLRWSEESGIVEHLRLERGYELVFKGGFGLDADLSNWERNQESPSPAAPSPPVLASKPEDLSPVGHADVPAPLELDEDVLVIDIPAERPAAGPKIITYEVDFERDIRAREEGGSGGTLSAAHLTALIDMAVGASSAEQAGPKEEGPTEGSARTAEPTDRSSGGRIVMAWEGPLEIGAVGNGEGLSGPLRRRLTASGSPVVFESAESRASAAEMTRHLESGFTQFKGGPGLSVEIARQGQSRLQAGGIVTLDMENRLAVLREDVRINLNGSVLEGQTVDAYFRAPQNQDQGRTARDLIERLECEQDVTFQTKAGKLGSRQLTVDMALDQQGRNLPRHAHAVGDVVLVEGRREMKARDTVDVTFGDLPTNERGEGESPQVKELHMRGGVTIFDPVKGWDIAGEKLDCRFDDQQVMTEGFIEGPAGQPACVKMGEYYIEGQTVMFDDARQWAHVPGPGIARFVLTEDLDGRRSDEPVPVEVRWTRQMTLRGDENVLVFDGQIVATSKNNVLTCDESLKVTLADVAPEPKVAKAQDPLGMWFLRPLEPEVQQVRFALGGEPKEPSPGRERFRKRATYILADGDAKLRSRSEHADSGRLRSLLELEGPRIAFDLDTRVATIEGRGTLGIQDYPTEEQVVGRAARDQGRRGLFSQLQSDGPSQTLVKWDSLMRYYYAHRVAEFEGGDEPVFLHHVSGAFIKSNDQMLHETGIGQEQLEKLRTSRLGRDTTLNCRRLLVEFETSAARDGGAGEMSIGQLKQFQASRDVILDDPELKVYGDRLDYVNDVQLISVRPAAGQKAKIYYMDPKTKRAQEALCHLPMDLELATWTIDAPGCRVSTARR